MALKPPPAVTLSTHSHYSEDENERSGEVKWNETRLNQQFRLPQQQQEDPHPGVDDPSCFIPLST